MFRGILLVSEKSTNMFLLTNLQLTVSGCRIKNQESISYLEVEFALI